jgi:hypothetical protein
VAMDLSCSRHPLSKGRYVDTLSIESRLNRLEKEAEGRYRTFVLRDGQRDRYTHTEVLAALSAAIRQREHHLLPYVRRIDTTVEAVPSMIRLVKVLLESRDRIQNEED